MIIHPPSDWFAHSWNWVQAQSKASCFDWSWCKHGVRHSWLQKVYYLLSLSLSLSTFSFPSSLETWMIWQVLLHTVQKRPELLKQKLWTILTGKDMWGLEGGFQSTWSLQQWVQTHNSPGKNKISCMYWLNVLWACLLFRVLLLNACLLRNTHACSN